MNAAHLATTRPMWKRVFLRTFVVISVVSALGIGLVFVRPDHAERIANLLRDALGPGFVAELENLVYTARDHVLQNVEGRGTPQVYWAETSSASAGTTGPMPPRFIPPFAVVAAPEDGHWEPIVDDIAPGAPVMFKSLVHPDPERGRAAVALLAVRSDAVRLHLFAGTEEPDVRGIPRRERPGVIPRSMHESVLAIFSGGFRTVNGRYAMRVGRRRFHTAREGACTLGIRNDGGVVVGDWAEIGPMDPELSAFRQAPPCLLVDTAFGPGIEQDDSHIWGVTVDGTTVLRRSGFGVSADGRWWIYAIGDELTTKALATALRAAGASDAILLDVNDAPTRCLFYRRTDTVPEGVSWLPHSVVKPGMYITRPWERDFFALTRLRR